MLFGKKWPTPNWTELLLDPSTTLRIRRYWSDYLIGTVKFSSVSGLHMDIQSGGYEGGFGVVASRPFLHGYVYCDEIVDGEVGHSCRHGPPPHRIKVCIVQKDNDRAIYRTLRQQAEPGWERRKKRSRSATA